MRLRKLPRQGPEARRRFSLGAGLCWELHGLCCHQHFQLDTVFTQLGTVFTVLPVHIMGFSWTFPMCYVVHVPFDWSSQELLQLQPTEPGELLENISVHEELIQSHFNCCSLPVQIRFRPGRGSASSGPKLVAMEICQVLTLESNKNQSVKIDPS